MSLIPIPESEQKSMRECVEYLREIAERVALVSPIASMRINGAAQDIELRIKTLEAMR